MQMMLLIQLAAQLLHRTRELVVEVESSSHENDDKSADSNGDSRGSEGQRRGVHIDATEMACKAVRDRASGMSKQVNRLRRLLLQSAVI